MPWDIWADQGYLTTIAGPVIQPEVIARTVAEIAEEYQLQLLAYDRWRINDFRRELEKIGSEIPMQPFGQGFRDMSPAVDKVEQHVAERKLRHGGNPILNMCAAGALCKAILRATASCTNQKATQRLMGLVALAMALGATSAEDTTMPTSLWDDPELKTVD